MDPNVALAQIRSHAASMEEAAGKSPQDLILYGLRLREAVTDLDEWLSKGGFLPDAWERQPEPEPPHRPRASELRAGMRIHYADDPPTGTHVLVRRLDPASGPSGWAVSHRQGGHRWESLLYDHEWDDNPKWSVS